MRFDSLRNPDSVFPFLPLDASDTGSDQQVGGGVTFTLNHHRTEELRKQLLADRVNDDGYRTTQTCVVPVSVAADAKPRVVRVFVHWTGGTTEPAKGGRLSGYNGCK